MKPSASESSSSLQAELASLEAQKRRLYAEIQNYPTPIAGCDQQFNHLLDEQARVNAELARVRAAIKALPECPPHS
jgi:hypothetical protein